MLKRAGMLLLLSVIFACSLAYADTESHRKAAENVLLALKINEKMALMTEDIIKNNKLYFEQLKIIQEWQNISHEYLNQMIEVTNAELSWSKLKENDISIWTNLFSEKELNVLLDSYRSSNIDVFADNITKGFRQSIELRQRRFKDVIARKHNNIMEELMKELIRNMIIPREEHLRTKVNNYYSAMNDKDYSAMYKMTTPYIKNSMSFEDWKKDLGFDSVNDEPNSKLYKRDLEKICNCKPWFYQIGPMAIRCVLLIKISTTNGKDQQTNANFGAMWEYIDGEWFAGYPFAELERCL